MYISIYRYRCSYDAGIWAALGVGTAGCHAQEQGQCVLGQGGVRVQPVLGESGVAGGG